jgi:hypothetical protein
MEATTLLISVSCLIDDWLAGRRLRQRSPQPTLADSEVLTMECVGEFWGIDTGKGRYEDFRRHWRDWFPALGRVHRTTLCVRRRIGGRSRPSSASSCSLGSASIRRSRSWTASRCRSAASPRADRCRRLAESAGFGRDEGPSRPSLGSAPTCGCAGPE